MNTWVPVAIPGLRPTPVGAGGFLDDVDGIFAPDESADLPMRSGEFEAIDLANPLILRVRYLPTPENVRTVRTTYGKKHARRVENAARLCAKAGIDLGRMSLKRGLLAQMADDPDGVETIIDTILGASPGPTETRALKMVPRGYAPFRPKARQKAAHIIEDAEVLACAVASRIPVTIDYVAENLRHWLMRRNARGEWVVRLAPKKTGRAIVMGMNAIQPFWRTASFCKHAHRIIVEREGQASACLTLLAMARAGHASAFMKTVAQKGGTWVVDLSAISDLASAVDALHRAMAADFLPFMATTPHVVRMDLSRDPYGLRRWTSFYIQETPGLIIQEMTPFKAEHRFFVVAGRIAATTPSGRATTLLDAFQGPGRCDPRIAVLERPAHDAGPYDRGEQHIRVDRPAVARMARLVRAFCRDLAAEAMELGLDLPIAFTVDVGLKSCGAAALIEINSMRNAGLYAVRYDRVFAALERLPWRSPVSPLPKIRRKKHGSPEDPGRAARRHPGG